MEILQLLAVPFKKAVSWANVLRNIKIDSSLTYQNWRACMLQCRLFVWSIDEQSRSGSAEFARTWGEFMIAVRPLVAHLLTFDCKAWALASGRRREALGAKVRHEILFRWYFFGKYGLKLNDDRCTETTRFCRFRKVQFPIEFVQMPFSESRKWAKLGFLKTNIGLPSTSTSSKSHKTRLKLMIWHQPIKIVSFKICWVSMKVKLWIMYHHMMIAVSNRTWGHLYLTRTLWRNKWKRKLTASSITRPR